MIQNFKIDYISPTADNFTSFPQTEQSQRIIQRNLTMLKDHADQLGNTIADKARSRAEEYGPANRINIIV